MKATLLISSPRPNSLTHQFAEIVESILREKGFERKIVDVYADNLQSIITLSQALDYHDGNVFPDMKNVMDAFSTSAVLFFVFPVWVYGVPAPLKGVLEKIVRPNITFKIEKSAARPLLTNIKRLCVICSSGQDNNFANQTDDPVYYTFKQLMADNFAPDCQYSYLRFFGTDHANEFGVQTFFERLRLGVAEIIS